MNTPEERGRGRRLTAVRNLFHPSKRPRRVAVVFGSGGARGWAHVGVMKALRETNFKPDLVVGTSIGAIAAAVQAADALDAFLAFSEDLDWFKASQLFFEFGIPHGGLIEGRKVAEFLREMLPVERIENLPLPYAAVATDIETAAEVVFSSGSLHEALRASISIPGVFSPVRIGGRLLVDGGVVNPLPVNVARAMGATHVVAVNINNALRAPAPDGVARPGDLAEAFRQHLLRMAEEPDDAVAGRRAGLAQRTRAKLIGGMAEMVNRIPAKRRGKTHDEGPKMNLFDVFTRTLRIAEDRLTLDCIRANPPDVLIEPAVGDIATMDFSRAAVAVQAGYDATMAAIQHL